MKAIKRYLSGLAALCAFHTMAVPTFTPLVDFGANPGELTASYYKAKADAEATVVLLHGCTQEGQQFAIDSGFLALAKQHNFNLLVPQQSSKNNIQGCFNWFSPQDTSKDSGELLSLKNMMLASAPAGDQQFYIVGLSAGGAMASAFIHHYADLVTGGAIVAGIPYPCADNLTKAIACMRHGPNPQQSALTKPANASINSAKQTLPRLSVWAGADDRVVNPKNARAITQQWLGETDQMLTYQAENKAGYKHTRWHNQSDVMLELIELEGGGHGFFIDQQQAREKTNPYILTANVSASQHIIAFWHLNK
ncbi:PHB depolymerase family esterase [Thalassotalea maritima]|uniref:extracellular catalytic domain type 1 short-chain-length polyhydroxyalkanoate depolymerase n=1 Tax=Thalassotalea maritima TaxID=3242416 RepID=UPI003526D5FB